ncbi:type II secretory pathway, ATPase PulE/Tfp pilus assembly pathway, ATPase PilB [Pleurocapsa sp. PCC 7327]|uniref:type II secretory pathway, ATPase PulE/Tfp pilus assembly pathway, ATPase PilB n=1 Tax=Pleurocapsa sp. PCC 7327 TaxID=118163 RepID=UPI00029F96EF|nr:type II secretory pathway, ATPase PulE/Tfp pilus assembly pathway, ATPase PilB [Pleurocapsa sp. PCC 7327]AFY75894.1 type II secretory pathway, ATPase PulE/Tfp pilus assembly pathway, ATPase PilB [Pleurocapsa sp. PCC 7327]
MPQPSDPFQFSQPEPAPSQTGWSASNFEQAFRLIDSLIPKAACLYHQILPLSLVEKHLTLGMVNLKDAAALDYVRSLLSSGDYCLKIQPIDSKTLQLILSAHSSSLQAAPSDLQDAKLAQQQIPQLPTNFNTQPTLIHDTFALERPNADSATHFNNRSALINERATLIVDNPEDLSPSLADSASDAFPPPPSATNFNEQPTLIVDSLDELSPELAERIFGSASPQNANSPAEELSDVASQPLLEVQTYSTSQSLDFLAKLSPQKLWQELLTRVLSEGIGRLYFERHSHHGRIFWSKNGVLQLSLEKVTPSVFQGTIDEFKRLLKLPATPLQQARKGELERYYRQERLLLRWQVIPGKYGEEGTLQVLRGKASELYQQRQMDELGQQALRLAESLERKLRQIQAMSKINPTRLEMLPSLRQIHEKINRSLEDLEKY